METGGRHRPASGKASSTTHHGVYTATRATHPRLHRSRHSRYTTSFKTSRPATAVMPPHPPYWRATSKRRHSTRTRCTGSWLCPFIWTSKKKMFQKQQCGQTNHLCAHGLTATSSLFDACVQMGCSGDAIRGWHAHTRTQAQAEAHLHGD